jgi:hypothetical protein
VIRKDAWANYYAHTGSASTVARQLALAGIAIVWIFKTDQSDGRIAIPMPLIWAALFMILSLAMDLGQYVLLSGAWWLFSRAKDRDSTIDADTQFLAPGNINTPGELLWLLKIALMLVGYAFIIGYLITKVRMA